MKPLTEIRKGCGKYLTSDGSWTLDCKENELCPTCQALLEQAQEFEKMIEELWKKNKTCMEIEGEDIECKVITKFKKELLKEVQDNSSEETNRGVKDEPCVNNLPETSDVCERGHPKNRHNASYGCSVYNGKGSCPCKKFKPKQELLKEVQGVKE
jgi:hypothetical protein